MDAFYSLICNLSCDVRVDTLQRRREREREKTELVLSECVGDRTREQIGNGEARVRGKNTWSMINAPTPITTVQRHHDASLKTELQCGLS